ncbi:MAG: hypothetical protein LBH59_00990 [Planctomycetaceae bacterium]|jgi:hypothetical protein|nr:hypothetical protein [Planctomycetaceae bacterium]
MGKNEFQHVRSGEPIVIPAATYNTMLDAAQAHRNRQINLTPHGNSFDSLFVHVVNETNKTLGRFDVVGLEEPFEKNNIDVFCNRIVFRGVVPQKKHSSKFAVIQQDAAPNMIVRACISGVTIVRIQIQNNFHNENYQMNYCDVKEGETGNLITGGQTEILWHNNSGINDICWGIIRIGSGHSIMFPVLLQHVGGEQGNDQKPATWKYDIADALTEEILIENIDPTTEPHQWKRPSIGALSTATFGYAHYRNDNELILGWINEVPLLAPCTNYV